MEGKWGYGVEKAADSSGGARMGTAATCPVVGFGGGHSPPSWEEGAWRTVGGSDPPAAALAAA
jgi:hypothetical protein